ncbi:caspase family protein [Bradyrhizobium sp. LjRoot220]|uniref:caspase family protein n=1 Tax=Bradyrhizobium sp. LjRoot220 TaxID=3342284 RepID=UPI003F4FEB2F
MALVIGNGAYQNAPALPNPLNDATDFSASLQRLGFEVRTLQNASFDEMRRALISFSQGARGAEFAIIFFAGHGMELNGENWLVPVDGQLVSDRDVENETISLQQLMRAVSDTSRLGLVILDACRNNPFLNRMQGSKRDSSRGLGRVEPSGNVLVAYSARAGTTASDGPSNGRNSPFTASLLRNIETPGIEIRMLFGVIRDDVMKATGRDQQPFDYGSLGGNAIYLKPPAAAAGGNVPRPPAVPPPVPSGTNPTVVATLQPNPSLALPIPRFRVVGVASDDVLNVRSDGDHAQIVGRLSPGERGITVVARSGDWWQIQAGTTTGWVASRFLEPDAGGSIRNTQFNGFAFQYTNEVASTVSDVSACVAMCSSAQNCLAYTFFVSQKLCRLMAKNDAIRVPNADAVSGLVEARR